MCTDRSTTAAAERTQGEYSFQIENSQDIGTETVFNSKTAGQGNKTQTTTEAPREPWINDHVGDHSIPHGCR
jgi:hypothetical protein